MNGSSIDYQLYSTVNMHYSKFSYFHRVDGRNLIKKTISAELDWAELGNKENKNCCTIWVDLKTIWTWPQTQNNLFITLKAKTIN